MTFFTGNYFAPVYFPASSGGGTAMPVFGVGGDYIYDKFPIVGLISHYELYGITGMTSSGAPTHGGYF